jgi:hypothetical protein
MSSLTLVTGFLVGVSMCFVGPSLMRRVFPPDRTNAVELARAASPDGLFDVVLVRDEWGGGMGGCMWFVFILPKGEKLPGKYEKAVFAADRLTQPTIVWKQSHLIEIKYDKAEIERFQNVWAWWDDRQSDSQRKTYFVEIRLAPSTPDYSILTPNGDFRTDP